ncbi:MAG: leucine-rich repeat domain-containing protein [Promethearchaeota archaeon]
MKKNIQPRKRLTVSVIRDWEIPNFTEPNSRYENLQDYFTSMETMADTLELWFNDASNFEKVLRCVDPAKITGIRASNLGLTALPDEFGNFTALRSVKLDHNQITTLPEGFGGLFPTPDSIDPKYIDPKYIDPVYGNTESLEDSFREPAQVLDLSYNRLRTLPEGFGNMRGLEDLNLSHNQLSGLPQEFGHMTRLRLLNLDHNQIRELPASFSRMEALRVLRLSHNNITQYPTPLEALLLLGGVDLDYNPIRYIDITNWKFRWGLVGVPSIGSIYIDWWRVEPPTEQELKEMLDSVPPGYAEWYKEFMMNEDEDRWYDHQWDNEEWIEEIRDRRRSPWYDFGMAQGRYCSSPFLKRIQPRPVAFYFDELLAGTLDLKYFPRIRAEATGVQKKFLLDKLIIPTPEHQLVQAFRDDLEIQTNNGLSLVF